MLLVNQPWDGREHRMGDQIIRLLQQEEPRFEAFRVCVAFVKAGGVLRLAPSLMAFRERGGRVEIVAGLDEGITTRQGLDLVQKYSTVAYVFRNPVSTFHPKVYMFETPGKCAIAFVGSSNLTAGGLYTNYEANLGLEFDLTVPADQKAYAGVLSVFLKACNVESGNARVLDAATLEELVKAGILADETRPARKRPSARKMHAAMSDLFPRTPVPPAPSVASQLAYLIPRVKMTGDPASAQHDLLELHSWEVFVMILGERDTRQKPGYSRDVYIPLAARDFRPEFWGWPSEFRPSSTETVGIYPERRIAMLVRPAAGQSQVVAGVRLYYYDRRHEFRLNCGRLIAGAMPGDLLVIQRSPTGTLFEEHTYEYEATVICTSHPEYDALKKECSYRIPRSPKRWGFA